MKNETTAPDEGPFYTRRGWQISAAALVVLLGLGITTVITSGPDERDDAAPRAVPSPSPSSARPSSASPTGADCPALPESDVIPTSGPTVDWALEGPVILPSSPSTGPARVDDHTGIARCFAHSPSGALVAAAQIGARYIVAPGWKKLMEEQTYGPGRDEMIKARGEFMRTAPPASPVPGELGQIAGYQVVTYSPDTAVFQLVVRFDTGELQESTATVRWEDGDWRYQLPEKSGVTKPVPDLDGYHVWGGI
ncbi:hypothetical protein [Streptomyces sp. NRRL F-5630]|uniref:hypothetical protein n=1 Tax=Streptomyces sp. NRRL F-5630 TaxID=1463864 RepID=UPI003EC079F9